MSEQTFSVRVGRDTATIEASNARSALHKWAEQNLEPGFSIMAYGQGGASFVVTGAHGTGMSATVQPLSDEAPSAETPSRGRKPRQPKAATAKLVLLYAKLLTVRRMGGPYRVENKFASQFEAHRQMMEKKYGHLYDLVSGVFMDGLKKEAEKEIIKHPMWGPGSLW